MKRILLTLAMLSMLAAPVMGQTDYGTNNNTNQGTTNDANTGTTNDVNTGTTTDMNNDTMANDDGSLPATASPLPLITLAGLGSLALGAWVARRRR